MKTENRLLRNIMTRGVITVPMDMRLKDIATILTEQELSGVAVVGPKSEVVGIISDMDIINVLAKEDWKNMTAESIMTSNVISTKPTSTIGDAVKIMKEKNIHRLLICSEQCMGSSQKPIGILSASDIVREMVRE